jgi:phosphatidylglycerol:prolipoprotein diacylglycerol transferase
MFPVIQIGPLALNTTMILLMGFVWIGGIVIGKTASKFGLIPVEIENLLIIGIVAGLVGARLIFIGSYPDAFAASPINVLSLNPGLLDLPSGFACGALGAIIYGKKKKFGLWNVLDGLTPFWGVFAVFLPIINLASGFEVGEAANIPWGLEQFGSKRHPVQIYGFIAAGLILVWIYACLRTRRAKPGLLFLGFVSLLSASTIFLDAFREQRVFLPGNFRITQVAALFLLITSLWLIEKRTNSGGLKNGNLEQQENYHSQIDREE